MLISFVYSVVSVVLVLGIMILVHEFGHFAAAKLFGVRVEVFSLGFGKRLWGFKRGDTDYRISALPLGGYVKMTGENPTDEHTGNSYEFVAHPRWQRLIIAAAGPAMNILLAVALLAGVFMVHYEHPIYLDQPATIGWAAPDSPAAKAGFQPGDQIVQIGQTQNPTWEDVLSKVALSPGQTVDVAVLRNGQRLQKSVVPEATTQDEIGSAGWLPDQPLTVSVLENNMPSQKVLKIGDDILAVDNKPVRSTEALKAHLQETGSKPVTLTIRRDGQELQVPITPQYDNERKEYRIGFGSSYPQRVDKLSFGAALNRSLDQNRKNSMLVLEMVKKMAERKVSMKQMSGPIGIARASGEFARQEGWTPILGFMAVISLQLGIFNLFPIPILDGGLIVFLLIESLIRRDINEGIKVRIYQAAFVCLMLFASIVIFNDVVKMLPGIAHHVQ